MYKVGQSVIIVDNVWCDGAPYHPDEPARNGIGKMGKIEEIKNRRKFAGNFKYIVRYDSISKSFRQQDLKPAGQLTIQFGVESV